MPTGYMTRTMFACVSICGILSTVGCLKNSQKQQQQQLFMFPSNIQQTLFGKCDTTSER